MKKKKGWVAILIILIVAALGVAGYFAWKILDKGSAQGSAYVQSVSKITGVGYVGLNNSYSGVVEAKEVVEVNPDSDLTIKECFVQAGDLVTVGMPLFCYDVDELSLTHEQLLIDITGLAGTIKTYNEEIEQLDKRIAKAKEADLYDLKLEKQTVELSLKKATYELADKKEKSVQMQEVIADSVVVSPVAGTVRSVRADNSSTNNFGYSDNSSTAYITIVSGNDYCVKGTVSEQTIYTLYEGMPVVIRSRVDRNATFAGEIYKINTTNESNNDNKYYGYDSGEQASKYSFYVSVEDISGLMMGQHVYIELGTADEEDSAWKLPSYYLILEGDNSYVYAQDDSGRIEKRSVTLGKYDQEADSYEIASGLELTDRIAFPDESVSVGMKTTETQYNDEPNPNNNNGGGMDMPSMGMSSMDGEPVYSTDDVVFGG